MHKTTDIIRRICELKHEAERACLSGTAGKLDAAARQATAEFDAELEQCKRQHEALLHGRSPESLVDFRDVDRDLEEWLQR